MSITSANAVLMLSIPPLFAIPQQLRRFAADDIYDIDAIKSVETMMGADGKLSGGWVPVARVQHVTLQGDSPSNNLFDVWQSAMDATQDTYVASGLIVLRGIRTKFVQSVGYLTGYKPVPPGKKVLQPRTYEITWETVAPQPTA